MARKLITHDDWLRSRSLVEARARRILNFFDLEKLRRATRREVREEAGRPERGR